MAFAMLDDRGKGEALHQSGACITAAWSCQEAFCCFVVGDCVCGLFRYVYVAFGLGRGWMTELLVPAVCEKWV